ncbi:hypothetical protein PAPYR_7524 [Paratrimastix pyriformis]|uniref:Uncharacterized protein n=1 Tax=Paratrimastix pyriformis TaxID=342808 RepID=A0ABQ8UCK7_9EUKA|nr:hypothetical protein PAPYR_7524 [Paratrimastix pyriformis]
MLDEFCKLFGHLGFSSGALPSSTLLKGIIESLQKGCSPAVSRDRIAVWIQKLLSSFMWQCYLKYRDDAPPSHLATLRHPQLTTLLTLQLRQNVFLRVPINVVGTGTCPFPAGWKGDQGAVCAGRPAPTKPAAAKSSVLAPLHHLPTSCPSDPPSRPSSSSSASQSRVPILASVWCVLGVLLFQPRMDRRRDFSWLRASTVYVCYTHARWYVGSKPPVQAF